MKRFLFTLTVVMFGLIGHAGADVIASWDVSQSPKNDNSLAGVSFNSNIEVSDVIANGVHLRNGKASEGQFSAKHWTNSNSPDLDQYYEFTISANGNESVLLNDITMPLAREMDCIKFTRGAEKWQLSASYNGFSSPGFYNSTLDISSTGDTQVTSSVFDLNSMVIQAGESVTFRLYGYGGTFWNNYAGLYADPSRGLRAIELTGTSAVPEPATASILLAGAVLMLHQRRKRPTKFH